MRHDFGIIRVGKTSDPLEITISNTREQELHISDIKLSVETNFTLDVNGGSDPLGSTNPTIKRGPGGTVTVTFNPASEGTFNAELIIHSDDPDNPTVTVSLIGRARYPKTFFVDADAQGDNDGSSWANAFNYLQDALAASFGGDEIWVTQDIYRPDMSIIWNKS